MGKNTIDVRDHNTTGVANTSAKGLQSTYKTCESQAGEENLQEPAVCVGERVFAAVEVGPLGAFEGGCAAARVHRNHRGASSDRITGSPAFPISTPTPTHDVRH